jgi:hypothetical protein
VTVLDMTQRILDALGSTLEPDVRNEARTRSRTSGCRPRKRAACSAGRRPSGSTRGMARTVAWYRDFARGP